ncbi:MAG TPA: lamin tail domain-containing protein, partial [Candidatus Saccharimonadales bacterium]|nr:lamin tail domain-containing protein [Candidatus Saccharimonadales bacterium]
SNGTTLMATISGDNGAPIWIQPGQYFVLHSSSIALADGTFGQQYAAKLSSTDKTVALFAPNFQTCAMEVVDAVGWGASTDGEGQPASLGVATNGDRLITRLRTVTGKYVDTNTNVFDFQATKIIKNTTIPSLATGSTLGTDSLQLLSATVTLPALGSGSTLDSLDMTGCEVPEVIPVPGDNGLENPLEEPPVVIDNEDATEQQSSKVSNSKSQPTIPARDIGLVSPQVTELLPNPGKPQTDASDEFIELYNSNNVVFDLSGFMLSNGKKQYVFPQGTLLEAKSFKAFYSGNTKLGLSNTQGEVRLLDPFGKAISVTQSYGTAKENQAWALAKGSWGWTMTPTPGSANAIKAPAAAKKKTSSNSSKNAASSKSASLANYTPKGVADVSEGVPVSEKLNPLHPGVLALVAIFAILYGAYEYRADVANRIHQLRLYRAARRENRRKS